MKTCEHCGLDITGGEEGWAEHLAYDHPKAWEAWYHAAWREQAEYRRWEASQWRRQ